jgi:DHA1 family multidrug resistance protein-like MFS transporter
MMGYGMVIPIMPFFIDSLGGSGRIFGLLIALYGITEFLFAPIWGGISDKIGRKPVLIVSVLGEGASMLMLGFSSRLWMLFTTRALAGIVSSATVPITLAYVSDGTSEEDRGKAIGMVGAAMGLGVILGPVIGGWLAGTSLILPFFIASGLCVAALLLIMFFVPESFPSGVLSSNSRHTRPSGNRKLWRALNSPIGILLAMAFLMSFAVNNFSGVFGLYALERYGFGPKQVGTMIMIMGGAAVISQSFLVGPMTKHCGEETMITILLFAGSVAFIVLILANAYTSVLLACSFLILTKTLLRPAIISLTTKRTILGQGATMGLCNAFMSLGRIAGPIWAGFAFDLHINYPYLSGAAILFIGFLVSVLLVRQPVAS